MIVPVSELFYHGLLINYTIGIVLTSMASVSNLMITPRINHVRLNLCEAILFPRWSMSPSSIISVYEKLWLPAASFENAAGSILVCKTILRQRSRQIQVVELRSASNHSWLRHYLKKRKSGRHKNAKKICECQHPNFENYLIPINNRSCLGYCL